MFKNASFCPTLGANRAEKREDALTLKSEKFGPSYPTTFYSQSHATPFRVRMFATWGVKL